MPELLSRLTDFDAPTGKPKFGPAAYPVIATKLALESRKLGLHRDVTPLKVFKLASAIRNGAGLGAIAAINAAKKPNKLAVTDGERDLTFKQLNESAERLAGAIDATAVGDGPVALCMRTSSRCVEGMFGIAKSGRGTLLINTELQRDQLLAVLEREKPSLVLHDSSYDSYFDDQYTVPRIAAEGPSNASRPTLQELEKTCKPMKGSHIRGQVTFLTSGTTGLPKGAPRTVTVDPLRLLSMGYSLLTRLPLRYNSTTITALPLFHLFGFAATVIATLLGGTLVLRQKFDAEETIRLIEEHEVGIIMAVPTMYARMLAVDPAIRAKHNTSSLFFALTGAAPLNPEMAVEFMDAFGDILYNGYGSSESGITTLATPQDQRLAPGSVGKPLGGIRFVLVQRDGEDVCAQGEVGELWVGGPMVFDGYTGDTPQPTLRDGLYNTGDLAYADQDGRIFIAGRQDDMILSGGENVYPQEIEDVLMTHPAVADATAIGVPDREFGQRIRGFVALEAGASANPDELVEFVKSRLERYKAPREVMVIDEIPRNPSGKVLRRVLPVD